MKRIIELIILLTIVSHTAAICQGDWALKKKANGISIYFREIPGSNIRELKVTSLMEGTLSAAVEVLLEVPGYPGWIYSIEEARVVKKISNKEFHFYSLANFPWPFKDREFVFDCFIENDVEHDRVLYVSNATSDVLPDSKEAVRVEYAVSNWTIVLKEPGLLDVEYFLSVDPGGWVPSWLVNLALDIGPVQTFTAFRQRVMAKGHR